MGRHGLGLAGVALAGAAAAGAMPGVAGDGPPGKLLEGKACGGFVIAGWLKTSIGRGEADVPLGNAVGVTVGKPITPGAVYVFGKLAAFCAAVYVFGVLAAFGGAVYVVGMPGVLGKVVALGVAPVPAEEENGNLSTGVVEVPGLLAAWPGEVVGHAVETVGVATTAPRGAPQSKGADAGS